MKTKPIGYIVVWDDASGICNPMGWSSDCKGALESHSGEVAVFDSRKDAQAAIRISVKCYELRVAQGVSGSELNSDFSPTYRKNAIILPLMGQKG